MASRIRDGFALLWCIIALTAMSGMLLLTVNWGRLVVTATQLQNTADASALAGAALVRTDQEAAKDKAVSIAGQNRVLGSQLHIRRTPDVVIGYFHFADRLFHTDAPTDPDDLTDVPAVHVIAPRTQGSLDGTIPMLLMETYGDMLGRNDVVTKAEIWRQAIAVSGSTKKAPGLLALNKSEDSSLELKGKGAVVVHDGDVQVDSGSGSAVRFTGNGGLQCDNLNIVGDMHGGKPELIDADVNRNSAYMPDPLASLPPPEQPETVRTGPDGNNHYWPGYYQGGISITSASPVVLEPGIYYLDGPLNLTGQGNVTGHGVMIYLSEKAATNGANKKAMDLTGQGDIDITPMDSGIYKNISVFQYRFPNTEDAPAINLSGLGNVSLGGVMYVSTAHVDINGNGETTVSLGSIIADTFRMTGEGLINVSPAVDPIPENLHVYLVQ